MENLTEDRNRVRTDLSRRLGALDQRLEILSDELRETTQRDTHPDLKSAARRSVMAKRESALSEIEAGRARLALLEDQAALTPWQMEKAQRRVAYSALL